MNMLNLKSFFNEFKDFILKRNALDTALGIVLGVSFGKVVSSLVNDIVTPPIGFILGGASFPNLKIVLKQAIMEKNRVIEPQVAIHYGNFLQSVIDFMIVALTVFLVLKATSKLIQTKEDARIDWTQFIKK